MKTYLNQDFNVLFSIILLIVMTKCDDNKAVDFTWKINIEETKIAVTEEVYIKTFSSVYFKYPTSVFTKSSVNIYVLFKNSLDIDNDLKFYMKYKNDTYNLRFNKFSKYNSDQHESVYALETLGKDLKNEVIENYLKLFENFKKEDFKKEDFKKEFEEIIKNSTFFFIDEKGNKYDIPYVKETDFYIYVNMDEKYKNIVIF